ncbi:hypothetical protein FO519_006574 [Halicephalobus sp. NKZ332]|nr:hypothetical protein FO519_006574 [Halicephalobus sp. NKZ332]
MKQYSTTPASNFCSCLTAIENHCLPPNGKLESPPHQIDSLRHDSEMGRLTYTISMLGMFAGIIVLLMVRSIRRSKSTIEVEALLDTMRFREELDFQQRQKRRLQKAKNKVTAWLTKNNGKLWSSSPQINITSIRQNSVQSSGSFIPEIIISKSEESGPRRVNSYTPSLSLIYDFETSRKNSTFSEISGSLDLFQVSDNSRNSDNFETSATFAIEAEYKAARQRSASRADTGESSASAPPAALAAIEKMKEKEKLPLRHSSTSSLSPGIHRHFLVHESAVDMG